MKLYKNKNIYILTLLTKKCITYRQMNKRLLMSVILLASILSVAILYLNTRSNKQTEKTKIINIQNENPKAPEKTFAYIKITQSCGSHFEGECTNVYAEPNTDSEVVAQVRNGIVLQIDKGVTDVSGFIWYKVAFQGVRYPERISGDWYIRSDSVEVFYNVGDIEISSTTPPQKTKRIVINLSTQMLYAYNNDVLFMKTVISTGFELTPTILGTFNILTKTPSRYMQGPQPGISGYYDLPGVPWVMYFTKYGAAIHGAYWHSEFGKTQSHGCVNLPPKQAQKLYEWTDLGTKITIENSTTN